MIDETVKPVKCEGKTQRGKNCPFKTTIQVVGVTVK